MARPTTGRMGERLFVHLAQPLDRGIGIRGGLKVGDEPLDFVIAPAELPDALVDLVADVAGVERGGWG